jgi:hypothetical protein
MLDLTQARPMPCALDALRPARFARITRLLGKAMAVGYRLARKHRYDDFRLERVQDAPFMVIPSVFNPKVPRTGEFLASQIDARLVGPDAHVLDMGTRAPGRGGGHQCRRGALRRHQRAAESSRAQDRAAARRSVRARGR